MTPVQIAKDLFEIHHHATIENGVIDIVYRERDLLPLLEKWGLPEPDFHGFYEEHEDHIATLCKKYLISPPGDTIEETMEEMGVTLLQLFKALDVTEERFKLILTGKWPITPKIAQSLEDVFMIDKEFWINRQALYMKRIQEAIEAEKETKEQ